MKQFGAQKDSDMNQKLIADLKFSVENSNKDKREADNQIKQLLREKMELDEDFKEYKDESEKIIQGLRVKKKKNFKVKKKIQDEISKKSEETESVMSEEDYSARMNGKKKNSWNILRPKKIFFSQI